MKIRATLYKTSDPKKVGYSIWQLRGDRLQRVWSMWKVLKFGGTCYKLLKG